MQLPLRDFFLRLPLLTGVGQQTRRACWHWLTEHPTITALTPADLNRLCQEAAISADRTQVLQQVFTSQLAKRVTENQRHTGCLTIVDAAYPEQLRETYAPPVVLYYLGDLRWLTVKGGDKMQVYGGLKM